MSLIEIAGFLTMDSATATSSRSRRIDPAHDVASSSFSGATSRVRKKRRSRGGGGGDDEETDIITSLAQDRGTWAARAYSSELEESEKRKQQRNSQRDTNPAERALEREENLEEAEVKLRNSQRRSLNQAMLAKIHEDKLAPAALPVGHCRTMGAATFELEHDHDEDDHKATNKMYASLFVGPATRIDTSTPRKEN